MGIESPRALAAGLYARTLGDSRHSSRRIEVSTRHVPHARCNVQCRRICSCAPIQRVSEECAKSVRLLVRSPLAEILTKSLELDPEGKLSCMSSVSRPTFVVRLKLYTHASVYGASHTHSSGRRTVRSPTWTAMLRRWANRGQASPNTAPAYSASWFQDLKLRMTQNSAATAYSSTTGTFSNIDPITAFHTTSYDDLENILFALIRSGQV